MRQSLPCADFRWLDHEEIDALHFQQVPDDAPEGYILEVDLDYPRELHDSHADFSLAPEKRGVPLEWLSHYQKALVENFHLPQRESERKLLLTFYPKRNYIIHYRNLKLYLELGLKLKVIHRVSKFSQRAFLKDFIDFNHNLRKQAKNAFQKNLSKLIMNSIYGKTIENPRQYNNVVIRVSEEEVLKNLQKPNLRQFAAISPENPTLEQTRVRGLLYPRDVQTGHVRIFLQAGQARFPRRSRSVQLHGLVHPPNHRPGCRLEAGDPCRNSPGYFWVPGRSPLVLSRKQNETRSVQKRAPKRSHSWICLFKTQTLFDETSLPRAIREGERSEKVRVP
ncbi:unnamed protein product [Ixodes persulcatus]